MVWLELLQDLKSHFDGHTSNPLQSKVHLELSAPLKSNLQLRT